MMNNEASDIEKGASLASPLPYILPEEDLAPLERNRTTITLRPKNLYDVFKCNGASVTLYIWRRIIVYLIYVSFVCFVERVACRNDGGTCHRIKQLDAVNGTFVLWMGFTAYLFQSFVSAGLARYNLTINSCRSIQGRINEIGMLLHARAKPIVAENTLTTVKRMMVACCYVMYDRPGFSIASGYFLAYAKKFLNEDEFEALERLAKSDRPYALLQWSQTCILEAIEKEEFRDTYTLSLRLSSAFERFRGTYGTLVDSLDDAILPLPFTRLIVINIYLIFFWLPWAMVTSLGFYIIPGAVVYFWFLDGMIAFVFMIDDPFLHPCNEKQPLIDVRSLTKENVGLVTRRWPSIKDSRPSTIATVVTGALPMDNCVKRE